MEILYNSDPIAKLDEESMYRVIGVEHVGDTRGQEWYTKVIGANQSMEGILPTTYGTIRDTNQN